MKVSDYIVDFLYTKLGITHAFVVQGGAICHVIDSIGRHPYMEYVCTAHEQAAAMAADGYARVTGRMGCAMATSGPGVTNMMTGVASLYYDSVPGIFIGGQVSRSRLKRHMAVRQLGFQEAPHVEMMRPITTYAALVDDPSQIRYQLEKAAHLAQSGRMGPVYLDICDDVQREEIEPEHLPSFGAVTVHHLRNIEAKVHAAFELLVQAKRPVLVLGAACRLAGCVEQAQALIARLQIPVGLTWATADLLDYDHPLNIGTFGISGTRRGNFAVQNADFILSIGSRLDTHATGTPTSTFAPHARKVIVDIDAAELAKFPAGGISVDIPICADVRDFFAAVERIQTPTMFVGAWCQQIGQWRMNYPSCTAEDRAQTGHVNPYYFLDVLSGATTDDEIIVADTGANVIQTYQAYRVRAGQRLFTSFNNTPMGHALSAAIGACFANGKRRVICLTGDGGLQLNMQELGTITAHRLPIKIFVFNNHGHGILQQTQEEWLDSRYHGSRADTGLADPRYEAIARAFNMYAAGVTAHSHLRSQIEWALGLQGPCLIDLNMSIDQRITPKLKYGDPIERMKPYLPEDEQAQNMICEPA